MSISVKCSDCGKGLKAPDTLAGQKARCPDCGAVVDVPNALDEMNASGGTPEAIVDELADDDADVPVDDVGSRLSCPMCGELIAAAAIKCRFCGETLNSKIRDRERQANSTLLANQLTAADIAICALCSPIACVVGVIAIITGQPARGLKMIALSFVMPFLWGAIMSIFQ